MQTSRRRFLTLLLALLGVAVIVFVLRWVGVFLPTERTLADRLIEKRAASPEIVLVTIDDASITEFNVWPWPRHIHAQLIDQLKKLGVKAIGYDVLFSEASTSTEDLALMAAVQKAGNVILASESILKPTANGLPTAEETLVPMSGLKEAAVGYGVTTLTPDADGVVRLAPLLIQTPDGEKKSFALQLSGVTTTPPLEDGLYRIPYVNVPGTFKHYRFSDVLNGNVSERDLAGRIVLVGATAKNLHDDHLTPFGSGQPMAGVEVQANILQGLLEHQTLLALPWYLNLCLLLVLALLVSLILWRLPLRYVPLAVLALALVYLVAALLASAYGFLLPVLYPLIALLGMTGADLIHRYWNEHKRRTWIQGAFGRYLAPQVVDRLISDPGALKLGGTKQNISILFSDIRGFTTLSEALGPEPLVAFLNEYLTHMTDLVLQTEGVLDKYIGDAVMAFWGPPLKDHVIRACRTALNMQRRLQELQPMWLAQGKPDVKIGIGVNTDDVMVGNMGSTRRFDYTVIGDGVNLASRLESLTKQYGVTVIIAENTKRVLPDTFVTRELDLVAVKGKTKPIAIFELLTDDPHNQTAKKLAEKFGEALALYRQRQWDAAKAAFQNVASAYDDKAAAVYVERCEEMKMNDPGPAWDGVYVAKEK